MTPDDKPSYEELEAKHQQALEALEHFHKHVEALTATLLNVISSAMKLARELKE